MTTRIKGRSKIGLLMKAIVLGLCLIYSASSIPQTNASVPSMIFDWVQGESGNPIQTLSMLEITELRVRDIKRRLARYHGYGPEEIAKMLDKKELINALAFEEHRTEQKETERKKRVALRRSIIVALLCVIFVMFRPLFQHAWEVLLVNTEVYTDKKKYELSRVVELKSGKGAFGLFLILIMDALRFWLSVSVILSWVMKSKYFFPVPHIPIRPAALLATASGNTGGAGALGNYGLNVGPMVISFVFKFVNGKLEYFVGKALSQALKRQKKEQKKEMKAARKEQEKQEAAIAKEERRAARKARRAERERRKAAAEAEAATAGEKATEEKDADSTNNGDAKDDVSSSVKESFTESQKNISSTAEAAARQSQPDYSTTFVTMEELD